MSRKRRLLSTLLFFLSLTFLFFFFNNLKGRQLLSKEVANAMTNNSLDGCYHVYIDFGSNVGIQVRKLFEPHLYPNATALPLYNKLFGSTRQRNESRVCAVGFEPNPNHEKRLIQLQAAYRKCGWPVTFHTRTAVGERDRQVEFFTDKKFGHMEWGGTVRKDNLRVNSSLGKVQMIRLSDFVRFVVATRKLPSAKGLKQPPAVLMKMDIENSEVETLTDLMVTGSLLHITKIMLDFHPNSVADESRRNFSGQWWHAMETLIEISSILHVIESYDDEDYHDTNFDLPLCAI